VRAASMGRAKYQSLCVLNIVVVCATLSFTIPCLLICSSLCVTHTQATFLYSSQLKAKSKLYSTVLAMLPCVMSDCFVCQMH